MRAENILIVGGAGYIGSYVNKELNRAGYKTIVVDNLSRGDERTVVAGTFIEGDLADKEFLNRLFTEHTFDAVIHLAAFLDVGESVREPAKYYQNNVANTLNLLNAMVAHQVKNFIFSSSAAIFGNPQQDAINEDHPKAPINPYGRTKLMVEEILSDYDRSDALRSSCLRYFNAAGGDPEGEIKNHTKKQSNLIPLALEKLLTEDPTITVFGNDYDTPDGTCIRDYIHIHDLATAHRLAMENLLSGGPSTRYNLGIGRGFSVKEVLDAVEKVTGKTLNIIEGPRREGDPPRLIADATLARKELGWKPIYDDLEVIIADAWKGFN